MMKTNSYFVLLALVSILSFACFAWLGTTGKQIQVPCKFGVQYEVYNVADPRVLKFLNDVMDEVIALFPAPIFHIGGDEVRYDHWNESQMVKDYMAQNNLGTPTELQIFFTNKVSNLLADKGRRMMGWNEIVGSKVNDYQKEAGKEMNTKLNPQTIVHFWKGDPKLIKEAIEKGYDVVNSYHDISAGGMITTLLEMCFANVEGGLEVNLDKIAEEDIVKLLFSENPGIIVQVKDRKAFEKLMENAGVGFAVIARPASERHILVSKEGIQYHFGIDYMRDVWYESSYKLDVKQSGNVCAGNRFENYKMQPLEFKFHKDFAGTLASYGLAADRKNPSGIKAAVIREKGSQCERETAYALYLAGFDVKDVHMKVGDEVEAVILTLDREERKMSLGIKQLKPDPCSCGINFISFHFCWISLNSL